MLIAETKGRTYAELDILFENKTPARRFAKTNVDQFSGRNMAITMERDGSSSDGEKLDVLRKEVV